jgi:hypothetical protein
LANSNNRHNLIYDLLLMTTVMLFATGQNLVPSMSQNRHRYVTLTGDTPLLTFKIFFHTVAIIFIIIFL